jgi:glycosyltransferase involved in cell wall biosynthesis
MSHPHNTFIFLNQATRPLYIDIINFFIKKDKRVVLFTGDIRTGSVPLSPDVKVKKWFRYNNKTYFTRIVTFFFYSLFTFIGLHRFIAKKTELVITTTPPFLPFFGLYFKKIFRMKYHLVIYDIYPDVMISLGIIKRYKLIDRIWTRLNKKLYKHASSIITISDGMANTIRYYCKAEKQINTVPNWVDSNFIQPVEKSKNWFAIENGQIDKFTVLYSGNLGTTHDFDTLLEVIKKLKPYSDISFIIIGDGFKKQYIEEYKQKNELDNLILLPLQPKEFLPFTLACADIGVITLSDEASNVSVPSKTYYMMAAGSAILALGAENSELGELIRNYKIGMNYSKGQVLGIVSYILELKNNNHAIKEFSINSRNTAKLFSPVNAERYYEIINN